MPNVVPPAKGLQPVYADLHIHLGWAGLAGGPVKITASRQLTLGNILLEAKERKGIGMIGVIDAATSGALDDLERLLAQGQVVEQAGGGLRFLGEVTLIPGAEVEVVHPASGKAVHLLCFFPGVRELREFSLWQSHRVRNRQLSSQMHHGTCAADVVVFVGQLGGIVIPAHIFTPFKAALGAAATIAEVIPPELWSHVPAVELGLSSDTQLADQLPELSQFSYITNSDAHSLGKIGREYNLLHVAVPTFDELVLALREEQGRRVAVNYGLDPRLGKYHRTYCLECDRRLDGDPPVLACGVDSTHPVVLGVLDRIRHYQRLQQDAAGAPRERPPYVHQVPLQFVPGVGKRTLERLLAAFGTEMDVLHRTSEEQLAEVVGSKRARTLVAAREGALAIRSGGGGVYGKVLSET